ncbi:hypothetical protein POM88_031605 [Heracleum sosnowskyi]|uniref:Uncharacterized protein n=1 Tax=Heracleum sosnowskyi TaxID=360622 RepID=A0AAD8HXS4_9APIA|nr:hypothetical protein POM88_031605 [Heracleum sosnowskyi]
MKSGKAEFDSFCSAVDEDIHCQDSLKYVIGQLKALGNRITGFWKKIMRNESPKRPPKIMDATEERVTNISDSPTPTAIVNDDKNNIKISLKHIIRQLVAVGTHIKGFCSQIFQSKNPKRPQNIANVTEEEVPSLYDSQNPAAIVDDNMCSFSKVNVAGPDKNVQRDSSLKQNAARGICDNSNEGNKKNCIRETEMFSHGSFQIVSDSSIKCGTSRDVDLNTEVVSDQQAVNFVPSTELSKHDGSVSRVDRGGVLSLVSIDSFSSEDEFSEADYVVV